MGLLDENRLFPIESSARTLARALYDTVKDAPIVSPHGHTDPRWFALNDAFPDPAQLFVTPDHYVFRMLHSQGIALEDLGVPRADGGAVETDGRKIWRRFAEHSHLFRATPSRMWLDHAFETVFGLTERLSAANADAQYDHIADCLTQESFRPRALFERFNIELLATTEGADDDLRHHQAIRESGWQGRVVTTYRPDSVIDPEHEEFRDALVRFHNMFQNEDLVLDKWFALQAGAPDRGGNVLPAVRQLMKHTDFHLKNPNRARSVIFSYCSANPGAFHRNDASGYVFWRERVIELDAFNPQVAARLARALDRWKKLAEPYRSAAREALARVAAKADLSNDVREVVDRALAD